MISALVITTNKPDRLWLLRKTIESIDKISIISQKVLSVDVFPEYSKSNTIVALAQANGWEIVYGCVSSRASMALNMVRGLALIKNEYLFYCEDHVVVEDFPSSTGIIYLFEECALARFGYLCMNTHIVPGYGIWVKEKPPIIHYNAGKLVLINDEESYEVGHVLVFKKSLILKDNYFINFPAAITKVDLFNKLLANGFNRHKGEPIEPSFSASWFELEYHKQFRVGICVKQDTLAKRPLSFIDFHKQAIIRFRDNDLDMCHPSVVNTNGDHSSLNIYF